MSRSQPSIGRIEQFRFQVLLALVTFFVVLAIEVKHPYFFLRDDNLHQNLPYYVHNFRSLLSGEFPLFNFHQFLGTPVHSCVQSAAFYLPNYIAVFMSRLVFGHYYATMEFLALFHLILATFGFFRLMRYFGLMEWSCCFGAIAWAFSGFVMTVGNSWIQIVGYAACLPWLLFYSLRQAEDKFSLWRFGVLVLVRLLIIMIGYPPYIIYLFTFEILTVGTIFLVTRNSSCGVHGDNRDSSIRHFVTFLVRQTSSYICMFVIAAPILLPALHQVSISANRNTAMPWKDYSRDSYSFVAWVNGLFAPLCDLDRLYWPEQQFMSHIGLLTVVFCVLSLTGKTSNRKIVTIFLALAVFSLLWANNTAVTKLFYSIPFYNRQRWPFKLVFFTSFFLVALSTFGIDAWLRKMTKADGRLRKFGTTLVLFFFLAHIVNFMAVYLAPEQRTLHLRKSRFSPIDEPLRSVINNGRIVSIVKSDAGGTLVFENDDLYDNPLLLGFNYATLFGLYHFAGYEVLVSEKNLKASLMRNEHAYFETDAPLDPLPQDLEYFRKWGVNWYVVEKSVPIRHSSMLTIAYSDNFRTILHDADAKPFVYWADGGNARGPRHEFTTNSICIRPSGEKSGQIVANLLYNPFFMATVDGKPTRIEESVDKQILITTQPGWREIRMTYYDPNFYNGLYIAGGFLAILSGSILLRRLARWRHWTANGPDNHEWK